MLEDDEVEPFGVFEDCQLEAIVEAEGVFGLPCSDGSDGDARAVRGVGVGARLGVQAEVDGLPFPSLALVECEVVEADAEVAFELGGLLGG